jgi:ADP-ribose pyrophosphatase YjhB (NUDIX family)
MEESEYNYHFGVYGVATRGSQLLCIRKNSGPYTGRYDLPGGSQEPGEGLTETLMREVKEETGYEVTYYSKNRIYDSFVYDESLGKQTHHIFALYDIRCSDNSDTIPEEVLDGKNDSDGAVWMDFMRLNEFNSSPLILKVIAEREGGQNILEKSVFADWKIKK